MKNNKSDKIVKKSLIQKEWLILIAGLILIIAGIVRAVYSKKEDVKKEVAKPVPIIVKHPEQVKKALPRETGIQAWTQPEGYISETQSERQIPDKGVGKEFPGGEAIDF